ncbi:hypothetical protein BJF90_43205 [Pseudonocardia sp. CNS-004]|nr:hypothetical protein BJF90_43205 [Pseudonocardia sp. CNS-004]
MSTPTGYMSRERETASSDEALLLRLGYSQVLYREMGGFSNFAISFTIISVLAGCLTSYYLAFNNGGPVAITWGWLLVGVFCVLVAMAMGEIASAMPTAGACTSGRPSSADRRGAGSRAGSTSSGRSP